MINAAVFECLPFTNVHKLCFRISLRLFHLTENRKRYQVEHLNKNQNCPCKGV